MPYAAAIFDLDGTLLDTLDDLAYSLNFVLKAKGLPVHETEKFKYFAGGGTDEMVRRALPEGSSPELQKEALAAYTEVYAEHCTDKTRPYDGIMELLASMKARGVALAVLSNKPHTPTLAVVAQNFNGIEFDAVLGARPGVPVKPDPAGALELSEFLKVKPEDILYFGDTSVDMLTARGAGMPAVGVLWGFRTREELEESGAAFIIERPSDALKLL